MEFYTGIALKRKIEKRKQNICELFHISKVEERDFISDIRENYFQSDWNRVLVVDGLKSLGKTTGLLQAIEEFDEALYLSAEENEDESAEAYISFLRCAEEKYIVIDEYDQIKDRGVLDAFLYELVCNGKRVAVILNDMFSLDDLKQGALLHKAVYSSVNALTYEEFCRLFQKDYSKESCEEFLRQGGTFHQPDSFENDMNESHLDRAFEAYVVQYLSENLQCYEHIVFLNSNDLQNENGLLLAVVNSDDHLAYLINVRRRNRQSIDDRLVSEQTEEIFPGAAIAGRYVVSEPACECSRVIGDKKIIFTSIGSPIMLEFDEFETHYEMLLSESL